MALKDTWKDLENYIEGVPDSGEMASADDINKIAHAVIENEENKADKNLSNLEDEVLKQKIEEIGIDVDYDDTELRLRDERLKYYGDFNIVPSDESLFYFYKSDNLAVVSGLKDKDISGEVVIPYKCTINGVEYLVTSIGEQSFVNAPNITKIILPNSITSFSIGAFDSCSMTTINIPEGVSYLGGVVFYGCSNLKSINIPCVVTTIEYRCFYNCTNMTSITIPTTVTYIGSQAFDGCEKLTITCAEGSYADTYAQENGIPVEYTSEVTKQFVLDNGGKPTIITEVTDTLILEDNQDAQLGEIASLVLAMPENIKPTYHSSFNFKSGETATSLTYTDTPIIWRGDDCDADGDFIPEANTIYEVSVKNLGVNGIVANVYNGIGAKIYVNDALGDIKSALDSIIDIQNSLMGVSE